MTISVIHPARNEHEEIGATVKSMQMAGANEILVFDDGSDSALPVTAGTIHFRHDKSRGPSVCRNLGGKAARGDVLVFADAHTRIEDLTGICNEAQSRQCIMVPSMQSLYGSGTVTGYGRNFILKGKENELIGFDRQNSLPKSRYTFCGGNWGGFFIMPKTVFNRIEGWVNHGFWGYNDPSLILKAWFAGIPTILDRDTIYKHKGKVETKFGYPVKAIEPLFNVLQTYFTLFDEKTFQEHWLPLFERTHKWMLNKGLERLKDAQILRERLAFQRSKVRCDSHFFSEWITEHGFNGRNA